MRYLGMTFKYIFKNFIFIFFFALIPSFFFAMSTDIHNIGAVADNIVTGEFDLSFVQLFNFFSLFSLKRWPFALAAFVLTLLFMAMLLSMMEKHMRVGSCSFRDLFKRIDYNLGSTFFILLLALIAYEFWALVTAGLCSLVVLIVTNGLARCILGIALACGMMVLLCYLVSLFLLWLPCRQITGYSFMDSLSYSSQISTGKRGNIFLAVLIPYLSCSLLQGIVVTVSAFADMRPVVFLCIEIIYIFVFLYYNVLMYVLFFDANGEERLDLKKKY